MGYMKAAIWEACVREDHRDWHSRFSRASIPRLLSALFPPCKLASSSSALLYPVLFSCASKLIPGSSLSSLHPVSPTAATRAIARMLLSHLKRPPLTLRPLVHRPSSCLPPNIHPTSLTPDTDTRLFFLFLATNLFLAARRAITLTCCWTSTTAVRGKRRRRRWTTW